MKKESTISVALKNSQGFTLLELLTVIGIIAVLTTMAVLSGWDSRKKANDTLALSDAKHIITVVTDNFFSRDDVDYRTGVGVFVSEIGTKTNAGSARSPVFTLSPGVVATATGRTATGGALGSINIYLYHSTGTGVTFAFYPGIFVRTFNVSMDEETGEVNTSF